MSLLAQVNQPSGNPTATGAPQFYFALDSTPADPTVTAPDFVATGAGAIPVGNFEARGNGTAPFPAEMFTLAQSAGTPQFSMGLLNVPTGVGSVGNDFAISRYDDNGGYQGAQLTITRSTGEVTIPNGLAVGVPALVGGGLLEIDGTLGLGQVYDTVYNTLPPALAPQIDFIVTRSSPFPASPLPAGATTSTVGAVFQVPTTGLYIMGGSVGINSAVGETFTCANGDFVSLQLATVPVGGLQGGVSIDMTPIPLGIEVDRVWDNTNVVKLTGGVNYQCSLSVYNLSNTMAYSAGNTVSSQITLAALC